MNLRLINDQRVSFSGSQQRYFLNDPDFRVDERYTVTGMDRTYAVLGKDVFGYSLDDSIESWVNRAFQNERSILDGADLVVDVLNVGVSRRSVKVRVVSRRVCSVESGLTEAEWHGFARDFDDLV